MSSREAFAHSRSAAARSASADGNGRVAVIVLAQPAQPQQRNKAATAWAGAARLSQSRPSIESQSRHAAVRVDLHAHMRDRFVTHDSFPNEMAPMGAELHLRKQWREAHAVLSKIVD